MTKDFDRKHLLIVGKLPRDRHQFVNELITGTNKTVYRFPPHIKTFDEYIEQVRKLFPFIPSGWKEQNPRKWARNQIWDFHLDWTENTHSILIIIEEFGEMEDRWKLEIIGSYLASSYDQEGQNNETNFQLIVTQDDDENLIEKAISIFGLRPNEKRTERQVILGKLSVIDLDSI